MRKKDPGTQHQTMSGQSRYVDISGRQNSQEQRTYGQAYRAWQAAGSPVLTSPCQVLSAWNRFLAGNSCHSRLSQTMQQVIQDLGNQ